MKSIEHLCRALLVADDRCHETDLLEAWRHFDNANQGPISFELVFFPLAYTNDLLLFLTLLDHIRSGFFGAVLLVPPAATWSRLRHCDIPGKVPLRTRLFPEGRAGLSPALQKKVHESNRCMEIAVWFAEQSLLCVARPVAMLFIFPEDLGGHHRDGPASPWTLQELRQLQGVSDARRGAAFLCRLAESEYRRPLGFLSNMDTFCSQLYDGWPSLSFTEDSLVYDGPLPKRCPCRNVHKTFKGLTQANDFISSATVSLGVSFWAGTAVHFRFYRFQFPWGWRLFCKFGTDASKAGIRLLTGFIVVFLEFLLSFLACR